MIASLRARLWLSYAALIVVVLTFVFVTLLWLFIRNPRLLYPEVALRLRLAGETLAERLQQVGLPQDVQKNPEYRRLQKELAERGYWAASLTQSGNRQILAELDREPPFQRMLLSIQRGQLVQDQVRSLRGRDGITWLYTWHAIDEQRYVLVSTIAPSLALGVLLRDDFYSSFFYAGLVALVLSFLLALWLGGSITSPLRKMVAASQAVASGQFASVPVEGPQEVRELAQAMNDMSQRVQSTQQSQRDFVANVSHELKTPLTSIQGFAQAILDGTAQTPEVLKQSAGIIYTESARMHRLVLDLLSLARLEAGTADLQREPVNITALLQAVVERFSLQAQQSQVKLVAELGEESLILTGDGDRLAQVFNNLVDNALKFTPAGGQVALSMRVEAGELLTLVQDSGKGIAPEDRARIFDRFYQVDRSRRGGGGRGVGLGLPIARQIVLAHSGKIWVESQAGQGSRFVVKIPLEISSDLSHSTKPKGKR